MRRRLRKWLGIVALARKQAELLKRFEALELQVAEMRGNVRPAVKAATAKPEPLQMKNWSEFISTIERGKEVNA